MIHPTKSLRFVHNTYGFQKICFIIQNHLTYINFNNLIQKNSNILVKFIDKILNSNSIKENVNFFVKFVKLAAKFYRSNIIACSNYIAPTVQKKGQFTQAY